MIPYNKEEEKVLDLKAKGNISSFIKTSENDSNNIDWKTVDSFGEEWLKFDKFDNQEIDALGDQYFDIVDDSMMNKNTTALDVGCGTGRWTKYISKKAKFVEAVDPSNAVLSAAHLLSGVDNIRITQAEVSDLPFNEGSFDFVFSLGVLHHIPDTKQAMHDCVKMLKSGGFFLVYIYYSLDNRGLLYKLLFHLSNVIRVLVNKLPQFLKSFVCDVLAVIFYLPFVWISKLVRFLFPKKPWYLKVPLSAYIDRSWQVIRNDSLDRFGTPLEQRFSKNEITSMMESAGLTKIIFSDKAPFWHAVGQKL